MTTVLERAAARNVRSFDTALPQGWFDEALSLTAINPSMHVVWSYDYDLFGAPQPVDAIGDLIVTLVELASPITRIQDDDRMKLQELVGTALRSVVVMDRSLASIGRHFEGRVSELEGILAR